MNYLGHDEVGLQRFSVYGFLPKSIRKFSKGEKACDIRLNQASFQKYKNF